MSKTPCHDTSSSFQSWIKLVLLVLGGLFGLIQAWVAVGSYAKQVETYRREVGISSIQELEKRLDELSQFQYVLFENIITANSGELPALADPDIYRRVGIGNNDQCAFEMFMELLGFCCDVIWLGEIPFENKTEISLKAKLRLRKFIYEYLNKYEMLFAARDENLFDAKLFNAQLTGFENKTGKFYLILKGLGKLDGYPALQKSINTMLANLGGGQATMNNWSFLETYRDFIVPTATLLAAIIAIFVTFIVAKRSFVRSAKLQHLYWRLERLINLFSMRDNQFSVKYDHRLFNNAYIAGNGRFVPSADLKRFIEELDWATQKIVNSLETEAIIFEDANVEYKKLYDDYLKNIDALKSIDSFVMCGVIRKHDDFVDKHSKLMIVVFDEIKRQLDGVQQRLREMGG